MKRVYDFLKEAGTYYLATVENDQPRVRPFGTVLMFEDKLYIQTGKQKNVSHQIHENNKFEISGMVGDSDWIRISGRLVLDERVEVQELMLDEYPELRPMYTTGKDGNSEVYYFADAEAVFWSFTKEPEVVKF